MAKRRRLDPAPLGPAVPAGTESETRLSAPFAAPRRAPIAEMAGDAAATAALREVSETLSRARAEGLLLRRLPLDAVDETYLVRDRIGTDIEAMEALLISLRERGQQTPIEVADLGEGRYGLISGWRRLSALRRLHRMGTGPDSVLAIARAPGAAAAAYRAMVEENEVRVGLSYYERARIVARAADRGVFADDRAALSELFASASRPRRSKIGSFVRIVRALDESLRFPTAMGERLGLRLAKELDARPDLENRLKQTLISAPAETAEAEIRAVTAALRTAPRPSPAVAGAVTLARGPGRVTLSGPALSDPRFVAALERWIARGGWAETEDVGTEDGGA